MKTVIDSGKGKRLLRLRPLFEYRELTMMLAFRDFKVRYAHTWLGVLWAFVQPISTLLIFVFVFHRVAGISSGSIPYPVYTMAGVSAWSFFAFVLSQSGQSIISSQQLVTKVYFPRLIIPISKALVGFIDFGIALLILFALMVFYKVTPSSNIVFLPIVVLMLLILSFAVGIWFSALTIRFRDVQYIIPFMVQIGLYITPVGYPSGSIPKKYILLYHANPMVGIVEGFRWCLFGDPLNATYFIISVAVILLLLITGIIYFTAVEGSIADIV